MSQIEQNKLDCLTLICEDQSREKMLELKRMIYTPNEDNIVRKPDETSKEFVDRLHKYYLEGRLTPNGMRKALGLDPI